MPPVSIPLLEQFHTKSCGADRGPGRRTLPALSAWPDGSSSVSHHRDRPQGAGNTLVCRKWCRGGSHTPRTAKARWAQIYTHVCTRTCAACKGTGMHSNTKITINRNPSHGYYFRGEVWDSHIQDSEPLAELKSPVGGDRRGPDCQSGGVGVPPCAGLHPWSRPGQSLHPGPGRGQDWWRGGGGCQRELAGLTASSSRGQSPACSPLRPALARPLHPKM